MLFCLGFWLPHLLEPERPAAGFIRALGLKIVTIFDLNGIGFVQSQIDGEACRSIADRIVLIDAV